MARFDWVVIGSRWTVGSPGLEVLVTGECMVQLRDCQFFEFRVD